MIDSLPKKPGHKQGFTLVELAIVLVIIGLIVGGVLVGNDLIRAAEVRAVMTEKEKFITSVFAFKNKYNCIPGDCPRATTYFGTNAAGCPVPNNTPVSMLTCDGTGDGIILSNEPYLVWQHLAAAGMWPGIFRGGWTAAADGTMFPPITNKRVYWYIEHVASGNWAGAELNTPLPRQNILTDASFNPSDLKVFTPTEAASFDTKYDDGSPVTGHIIAFSDWMLTNCTNPQTAPAPNAVYDTTQTGINCSPTFLRLGF